MKTNLLDQTLARTLTALKGISRDDVMRLPILDCALILDSLPDAPDLINLRSHLAGRLRHQLQPRWIRESDLFEVFCVLTAVWKHNLTRVTGNHLTHAIQRLVASEVEVGGPYSSDDKVDIAANLQIASFVNLVAQPLPNMDAFFDRLVAAGHFEDTELTNPYVLYLFSKTYNNSTITNYINKPRALTAAHRAIALATLKNKSLPMQRKLLSALCHEQLPTGFWPGEPLVYDHTASDITTTAFIAEILINYQKILTPSKPATFALSRKHQVIVRATKQLFDARTEPLRSAIRTEIDKICRTDSGREITLLAYAFANALKDPPHLTNRQYTMLGSASVCGWVAYTIYDNFLDNEGVPAKLPIANITMRASLDCFKVALPDQAHFQTYVADIFAKMDEANAWEVNNCRFALKDGTIVIAQLPSYGQCSVLATRSFAHALGPMAVLMQVAEITPKEVRHIEAAFRQYLIGRQLCDDVLDWLEDIQAGQASYVTAAILRDMRLQLGSYVLADLIVTMQKQFRQTTMPRVCKLALRHLHRARQGFMRHGYMQSTNGVFALIETLELTIHESLDQHAKARTFMKTPTRRG